MFLNDLVLLLKIHKNIILAIIEKIHKHYFYCTRKSVLSYYIRTNNIILNKLIYKFGCGHFFIYMKSVAFATNLLGLVLSLKQIGLYGVIKCR